MELERLLPLLRGVAGDLMKEDKILQVMPNVTLAMHLLTELKSPDSFWKPYLGGFDRNFLGSVIAPELRPSNRFVCLSAFMT